MGIWYFPQESSIIYDVSTLKIGIQIVPWQSWNVKFTECRILSEETERSLDIRDAMYTGSLYWTWGVRSEIQWLVRAEHPRMTKQTLPWTLTRATHTFFPDHLLPVSAFISNALTLSVIMTSFDPSALPLLPWTTSHGRKDPSVLCETSPKWTLECSITNSEFPQKPRVLGMGNFPSEILRAEKAAEYPEPISRMV